MGNFWCCHKTKSDAEKAALIKKSKIIDEILETEKTYVKNLKLLETNFLIPLRASKGLIVKEETIQKIFGDIDTITKINEMFLQDLESAASQNTNEISKLIKKFSQIFKLYIPYISNYNTSSIIIKEEKTKNKKFSDFLKEKSEKLIKENERIYDLSSFLILPIQVRKSILITRDYLDISYY